MKVRRADPKLVWCHFDRMREVCDAVVAFDASVVESVDFDRYSLPSIASGDHFCSQPLVAVEMQPLSVTIFITQHGRE